MKVALILCLLSLSLARLYFPRDSTNFVRQTPKPLSEGDEVFLIIEGVLQGIALDSDINDIQDCIKDTLAIKESFLKAVSLLKLRTLTSASEALKEIKAALNTLPKVLSDCGDSLRDSSRVFHVLNIFENPMTFSFNDGQILVNGVDLHKDFYDAVQAYETKQWKMFGFYIGAALMKVQGTGIIVIA
ncbi:unnamed protein product [Blepharisma stoltei]|uniref:Uncharacterized protein n=1 Tax=Blepharisma stoltei TaxID=1481888 RepID=A0AAU9IT34_9CILI|nr:unnamed protein product [Blepharisma stoltei]